MQPREQGLDAYIDPVRGRTGQPHLLARRTAPQTGVEAPWGRIDRQYRYPAGTRTEEEVLVQQVKQDKDRTSEVIDDRRWLSVR